MSNFRIQESYGHLKAHYMHQVFYTIFVFQKTINTELCAEVSL